MPLAIGLSMLMFAAFGTPAVASTSLPVIHANIPQPETVRQYVVSYFSDIPIMVDIAECESHFNQYSANGSLYHGEINHSDVGVMQINEYYHEAEAKTIGIDLSTLNGNLQFARHLYKEEGTAPWNSSSKCWSASESAKTLAMNNYK